MPGTLFGDSFRGGLFVSLQWLRVGTDDDSFEFVLHAGASLFFLRSLM
jgi:hypothetical protein